MLHVSAQSSHKKSKSMGGHGIFFKIGVVGHGVTKINESNEITRKFVKNEIWLELHLIHNKSNISQHIRKDWDFSRRVSMLSLLIPALDLKYFL